MTWSGVELAEFVPLEPVAVAAVSDRWVVACSSTGSPYGSGHFTVIDALDGSSRSFSGLPTQQRLVGTATEADGLVWTASTGSLGSMRVLNSIDPLSGAVGTHGNVMQNVASMVGGSTWVAVATNGIPIQIFDIANDTMVGQFNVTTSGVLGELGNRLFTVAAGVFREIDPTTGAIAATWPRPGSNPFSGTRGARVGNRLWWPIVDGAVWLDPVGGTTGTVTATPAGRPWIPAPGWTPGPDGMLYHFHQSTGTMSVFNPTNGRWADRALPTIRGRRYMVEAANGKLWVPSGEPVGT